MIGRFDMDSINELQDMYVESANQADNILKYLYLSKEDAMIIHAFTSILLYFEKGIKNPELERKLEQYMISENCVALFPLEDRVKNRIAEIIFSF